MELSIATHPFPNPMFRPPTPLSELAHRSDRSTDLETPDARTDAFARDKIVALSSAVDTRLGLNAKLATGQTLKPYDTLMLPYREESTRVSVVV